VALSAGGVLFAIGLIGLYTRLQGRARGFGIAGVALAAVSLLWCPMLGLMKKRLGARLNSAATTGEGRQNLLCAYLAAAVLLGLLTNNLFGIWWLDPTVGLLIAALALNEGRAAWCGETCTCC